MERVYGAYQERGHTMRNVSPVEPVDRVDAPALDVSMEAALRSQG